MAQSLSKVLLHIIFSTKNREKLIPESLELELHTYIASICRAHGSEAYRVGGTSNHIHIACLLPRNLLISKLLEEIKKSSSLWIKKKDNELKNFSWQAGYGVFSVSQSHLSMLIKYIENQHKHHEKKSFKDEYLELLEKYNVEYDDQYLWK